MDQENEHHAAATDTEAATGQDEGTGKKRRRRRRGKRRAEAVATDGTAAPADTDSLDDTSDDSSDDDSDDRDEQNTEAAPDGAAAGEQRKKKRRRKKKRSGDQPTEQSSDTPAPPPSEPTAPPVVPAADAPARPARPERPKRAERQERAQQQDRQPPKDRPAKEIPSRGSVLQRRMSRMNNVDDEQRSDEPIAILPPPTVVTVDAYVSHLRGWQREVVTTIRSIIRNAAPDIEEDILWSQPVYSLNGPMCYVKAFSDHVNFGFWRGVELDDPDHLLVGELMKMRHIRIGHVNEVRRDRFEAWVRQAVRLNKEKGDPTSF